MVLKLSGRTATAVEDPCWFWLLVVNLEYSFARSAHGEAVSLSLTRVNTCGRLASSGGSSRRGVAEGALLILTEAASYSKGFVSVVGLKTESSLFTGVTLSAMSMGSSLPIIDRGSSPRDRAMPVASLSKDASDEIDDLCFLGGDFLVRSVSLGTGRLAGEESLADPVATATCSGVSGESSSVPEDRRFL